MSTENNYKHLEHRPGRLVRQPYIKGIKIRADTLYSAFVEKIDDDGSVEPGRTPEEIAADYNLPLEAVREAIDWCEKHYDVMLADRTGRTAWRPRRGWTTPTTNTTLASISRPLHRKSGGVF